MKIYIHCSNGDGASALCGPQPSAPQIARKSFVCLMGSAQLEDLCGHCRSLVEEQSKAALGALQTFPLYASTESGPTWEQLGRGGTKTPTPQKRPLSPSLVPSFPLLRWAYAMHDLICTLDQLIQAACRYPRDKTHLVAEQKALDLATAAVAFMIQLAIEDGYDALEMRDMEQHLRSLMTSPEPGSRLETDRSTP